MKILSSFIIILVIFSMVSCKFEQKTEDTPNSIIYSGGDIITMDSDSPKYVEVLVVNEGQIFFAGDLSETKAKAGGNHEFIDLKGMEHCRTKTL